MMRDLAVEQHSLQNGLVLNCPNRDCPASTQVIDQEIHRKNAQPALYHLCLVSESTLYFLLMSAHHILRLHSPLKTVFNKLEDTYKAYCNTFKNHTVATHHAGAGQTLG